MIEEFGISWPTVLWQTLNLVLVILIFIAIPVMLWRKIRKWNEKRDEQIASIHEDLHEIKEALKKESN